VKWTADQVFQVTGRNPKLDIAMELERIALEDEYFVKRRLYPNLDFYSGIIYQAMGLKPETFKVLFAIPPTVGWLAQMAGNAGGYRAEDRPASPDVYGKAGPPNRCHSSGAASPLHPWQSRRHHLAAFLHL
jgi:hypothetical protein